MGKSKKRIFNKNTDSKGSVFKRSEIINKIFSDLKNNTICEETKKFIGLFGITLEELAEAGASYEEISVIKKLTTLT